MSVLNRICRQLENILGQLFGEELPTARKRLKHLGGLITIYLGIATGAFAFVDHVPWVASPYVVLPFIVWVWVHLGFDIIPFFAKPPWRSGIVVLWCLAVVTVSTAVGFRIEWRSFLDGSEPASEFDRLSWSENLLDVSSFSFLSTDLRAGTPRLTAELFRTRAGNDTVLLGLSANSALEVEREIDVQSEHLGYVAVLANLSATEAVDARLYLLRTGKDPVVLDTMVLGEPIQRRYPITAAAGGTAKLLLTLRNTGDASVDVTLTRLDMTSIPSGGNLLIHAVQTWDGKNLDGSYDEFWYNIFKLDEGGGEPLFHRTVRIADGGFTLVPGIGAGRFLVEGSFHSIMLERLGPVELDTGMGAFLRLNVPAAVRLPVRVIREDTNAPIAGAQLLVTANGEGGRLVRGGPDPKFHVFTDGTGKAHLWLYPTVRSGDHYLIKAMLGDKLIAHTTFDLPPGPRNVPNDLILRAVVP